MKNTSNYHIKTEDDKLIFTTSSFSAEKTSVLHSGVYTREFSSMLLASAISVLFYMGLISANVNPAFLRYIIIVLLFVAGFLAANKYIFKEKKIEVIFDKSVKTAIITRFGIISKKKKLYPLKISGQSNFGPESSPLKIWMELNLYSKSQHSMGAQCRN